MNPTTRRSFVDYSSSVSRRQRVINVGRAVREAEVPNFPDPLRKRVRILAEYDLFGDIMTESWEKDYLEAAQNRIEIVDSIEAIIVLTGAFGLRRVVFIVDANLVVGEEEFMKNEAYEILCDIVREQDVRVNFIAPMD